MEDVLWSRGIFRITSRKEIEPTDDDKKIKWENRCDEACGSIGMSISTDLRFHISGIDELDQAWEKLESMFGKHNEIRGHLLENELIPWIQMIFHALKTIYLSIKLLYSYVKNARLIKKTNNVFIIFFPNFDLHILFLYLHSTPWKNPWMQLDMKSPVFNAFVSPWLERNISSYILE